MNDELLIDIWSTLLTHISEKFRKDAAVDFISTLAEHGIKGFDLEHYTGVDQYLDLAITQVSELTDDDELEDDDD